MVMHILIKMEINPLDLDHQCFHTPHYLPSDSECFFIE